MTGTFACNSSRIRDTTKTTPARGGTRVLRGLTTSKGWLHE